MTIELTECKRNRLRFWLREYAKFNRVCAQALMKMTRDKDDNPETKKVIRAQLKLAAEVENFNCRHLGEKLK